MGAGDRLAASTKPTSIGRSQHCSGSTSGRLVAVVKARAKHPWHAVWPHPWVAAAESGAGWSHTTHGGVGGTCRPAAASPTPPVPCLCARRALKNTNKRQRAEKATSLLSSARPSPSIAHGLAQLLPLPVLRARHKCSFSGVLEALTAILFGMMMHIKGAVASRPQHPPTPPDNILKRHKERHGNVRVEQSRARAAPRRLPTPAGSPACPTRPAGTAFATHENDRQGQKQPKYTPVGCRSSTPVNARRVASITRRATRRTLVTQPPPSCCARLDQTRWTHCERRRRPHPTSPPRGPLPRPLGGRTGHASHVSRT